MAFWLGLLSVAQKIKEEEVGIIDTSPGEKNKYSHGNTVYAIKMHEPQMVSAETLVIS